MVKAGFDYSTGIARLPSQIFDALTENPIIPVALISVAAITGLVVNQFTSFRFRNIFSRKELSKEETDLYIKDARKIVEEEMEKDE